MSNLVSVIIPTLHSAQFLEQTLTSLRNQTYKNLEILVVDGGSKDSTLKIATQYGAKVIKSKLGRSLQKNTGAAAAQGKYLYFVDDDFIVAPDVVEQAVNLIEQSMYDVVEVHNTSDPSISFWSRIRKFERDMFINDKHSVSPRFVPKIIFDQLGGFNPDMIAGEDYDFFNKVKSAGLRMGHTYSFEIHLGEPKSLWDVVIKHFFYGRSVGLEGLVGKKQQVGGELTIWQKLPLKPAYLRNWYKFILHPILTTGFLVYQVSRFTAAGLGFVYGLISKPKQDKTFR